MTTKRNLIWVAALGIFGLLMNCLVPTFLSAPQEVAASNHREAPLISQDPVADATDLYAFVSPDRPDTVTFIGNFIPFESPAAGPEFFHFGTDVLYELHLDNVGDAQDHISFQFQFYDKIINPNTFMYNTGPFSSPSDLQYNNRQYMGVTRLDAPADGSCKNMSLANCPNAKVTKLGQDIAVAPARVGPSSTPVYPALQQMSIADLENGTRVFAGPRADSFFLDLGGFFDLVHIRNPGINAFAGFNVHTISLQIPINLITNNSSRPTNPGDAAAVVGSYLTTSRRTMKVFNESDPNGTGLQTTSGNWVQIQRLGMPLTNEVVVPLALKDTFNSLKPWQDATIPAVVSLITDPEPARVLKSLGLKVPPTPRVDILAVFATGVKGLNQPPNVVPSEQLRLNVAIPPSANPNRLGVLAGDLAGFPNGRRLNDDVVDASLRVIAGVLVDGFNVAPNNALGDNVDAPFAQLLTTFPYQAMPYDAEAFNPGNSIPSRNTNQNDPSKP